MTRPRGLMAGLIGALIAGEGQAETLYFCWLGAQGYSMTGQMQIAPAAQGKKLITEADVTGFAITGYLEGRPLGQWDLDALGPETSWILHYDPQAQVFLTPDALGQSVSQAWNADGTATDCGDPGFGFNLGNFAQDFCLNGAWLRESGTPPETPFAVSREPVDPLCRIIVPLS